MFWFFFLALKIQVGSCPLGMVKIDSFCIDRYEAPNLKGQEPTTGVSFFEAKASCQAGGKRLCLETEWTRACQGPDRDLWSYGSQHDETSCNNGRQWIAFDIDQWVKNPTKEATRLWGGEPSGSRLTCQTKEGVFDLTGNLEEWVESPGYRYPGVLKGGFWSKSWPTCQERNDVHEPQFRFYETGYRCCQDLVFDMKVTFSLMGYR